MNRLKAKLDVVKHMFENATLKKKKDALQALMNIIEYDIKEYNNLPSQLKTESYIINRLMKYEKKISNINVLHNEFLSKHTYNKNIIKDDKKSLPDILYYI